MRGFGLYVSQLLSYRCFIIEGGNMKPEEIKQDIELNLNELIILLGMVSGQRMAGIYQVSESHWEQLQQLHLKLCDALAKSTVMLRGGNEHGNGSN
jgi:hypothetical protein